MRNRLHLTLGAICLAAVCAVFSAAPSNATTLILAHNGTTALNPNNPSDPSGSGLADVQLTCTFSSSPLGEVCTKNYLSNDRHELTWSGSGMLGEEIINSTGTPWTGYHFEWSGFDTFTPALGTVDCAAGQNPDCATITQTNDELWISFHEPLTPGTGPDSIFVVFVVEGTGTLRQHPTIPEPGTLALFGLGLAGLGFARRRKAAA